MKRKIKRWIAMISVLIVAGFSAAFGQGYMQQVLKTRLETGSVQVKITELEKQNGTVQKIDESLRRKGTGGEKHVGEAATGRFLSYIPRITVSGSDCYIRLHVSLKGNGTVRIPVNEETIPDIGEKWVRKGDYFYCTRAMQKGETQDPFEGIQIPQGMKNISRVRIDVRADALQAAHVHPDFGADEPWDTVAGKESKGEETKANRIVFRKAREVECTATDLFDSPESFLPGDCKTGQLIIVNRSGRDAEVYLRGEGKEKELLQQMKLLIRCGNEIIYEGFLQSDEFRENVRIAYLPRGSEEKVRLALTLPIETNNRFAGMQADVSLILSMKYAGQDRSEAVNTGERIVPLVIALALMVIAAASVVFAIACCRRRT